MSRYDAVVIGGGHNGLTAAAYLAKGGRKVLVVERRDVLGGLAAGEEFHSGYRTAGVLHETSGVRGWVEEELGLAQHGLRRLDEASSIFVPQADDKAGLLLDRDPKRVADELSRLGPNEASGYEAYREFLGGIEAVVRRLTDRVPPEIFEPRLPDLLALGRSGAALRLLGGDRMLELLRVAPMAAADWLDELFESPLLCAALAGPAVHHTVVGPRAPASAANLLLAECTAERPIAGGGAALVSALEAAARARGVEIRTGVEVERLVFAEGSVNGVRLVGGEELSAPVVAASCDPKHLLLALVPPAMLAREFEHEITHFRTRGTAAKVNLALSAYPKFASRPDLRPSRIRTGESIDELERAADAIKYREVSERPILDVHIPTVDSPELAPEGHHVASILVHYVPYALESGWSGERREELYSRVVGELTRYTPGVEGSIVGHEVLTPADLEVRYGVTGGHLHHGEHALDQLVVRPVHGAARYATPLEGLYLCGAGSHPGGGLTCVPGALAAKTILSR